MSDRKVDISHSLKIVMRAWDSFAPTLSIEYLNRAPAPPYSDSIEEEDIDPNQAQDIVALLNEFISLSSKFGVGGGGC